MAKKKATALKPKVKKKGVASDAANKPVKDKAGELKAREKADKATDQIKKNNTLGEYDTRMEKCRKAAEFCAGEYFQKEFEIRKASVDAAYKRLREAVKTKTHKLETVDDLKPYTSATADLKKAVASLDEWTYPARRDCLSLMAHLLQYGHQPLFENEMNMEANWNHEKGEIVFSKRTK